MVYVNNKKFACESCIKGHRSSSCHHTDRPLFEIKKKGRPVSQCTKCRELRQSKKVHSKCTCDPSIDRSRQEQLVPLSAGSKSKRYIPIVPALPNGLKDVLQRAKAPTSSPDSRQKVDTLLNPCSCSDLWNCRCLASASTSQLSNDAPHLKSFTLDALAHAASLQSYDGRIPFQPSTSTQISRVRTPSPVQVSRKRSKRSTHRHSPGPSLPPIRVSTPAYPSFSNTPYPEFNAMPPMSEIVSLAGSGCTCGVQCACPGCIEHRGPEHASQDHRDCADGCGTCIDYSTRDLGYRPMLREGNIGIAVAESVSASAGPSPSPGSPASFLDRFYARAAALPPPPMHRRGGPFDFADTSGSYRSGDPHQAPISLPKLDCCGGACLCPSDGCNCGSSCGGACLDHRFLTTRPAEPSTEAAHASPSSSAPRSCCAGKNPVAVVV
ncbi:ACE1 transcription factor [Ephemerocybe angulata]|uniref:ACE1 transcription factor n=1 Tax=Ephemerocybe angulata TaxID=980116 RepID=A0A8H6MF45_9AGAR|nr:ACE1 transcription factor [Tulosesus angulatus]